MQIFEQFIADNNPENKPFKLFTVTRFHGFGKLNFSMLFSSIQDWQKIGTWDSKDIEGIDVYSEGKS